MKNNTNSEYNYAEMLKNNFSISEIESLVDKILCENFNCNEQPLYKKECDFVLPIYDVKNNNYL